MSNPISSATRRARFGASIVALAPAVMLVGLFAHPYIATLPDEAAVAASVTADTTRWGLVHLTVGVASGLLVLAFLAIRSYLRGTGEDRWSILALPFIVVGSTLFAVLPGMEFAPLAAAEAGGDVQAVQAAGIGRGCPGPVVPPRSGEGRSHLRDRDLRVCQGDR